MATNYTNFKDFNDKYPNIGASHNDWMEMFYSFGFIGLLNLIFFYVLMIRNLKMLIKQKSPMITGYLSAVLIFIFMIVRLNIARLSYFCVKYIPYGKKKGDRNEH